MNHIYKYSCVDIIICFILMSFVFVSVFYFYTSREAITLYIGVTVNEIHLLRVGIDRILSSGVIYCASNWGSMVQRTV